MSRLFNGSTDLMTFAPVDWSFGTILIVARIVTTTDGSWLSFVEGENSGGTLLYAFGRHVSGNLYLANNVSNSTAVTVQDADGWAIYAVTKATGTAAPTLHKLPIGGTRTSTPGGVTLTDSPSLGAGRIKLGGDDDPANIRLAAVAIFSGTVLTPTQIDGIGSAKTTASIAALSPTWLVDDSDAFATDLIGSADRTAISGTTDDPDDPAGWVYGLGGGTSVVGASLRQPTVLRTIQGASARQPWTLRTLRGASLREPFSVIGIAFAALRQRYTVRTIVGASLRQPAALRTLKGGSLRQPSTLNGAVGSSLRQRYGVTGVVGGSLRQPSRVLNAVGASSRQPFNVGQPGVALGLWLPLQLSTNLTTVGGSLRQPGRVLNVTGASARQPWVLRVVTGASLREPYQVRTLRGASSRQPFILRSVTGTGLRQPFIVEQVGVVGGTLRQSYTLHTVQGGSARQPSLVLVTVSGRVRQTYQVGGLLLTAGASLRQPYRVGTVVFATGRVGRLQKPRTGHAKKIGVVP